MAECKFKTGDAVEVQRPDRYIKSVADKVRGRVGIVERRFQRLGSPGWTVVVRFQKRTARGREFVDFWPESSLQPVAQPNAAGEV